MSTLEASATSPGVAIETIEVGQRVATVHDTSDTVVDETWVAVDLVVEASASATFITLLRPAKWWAERDVEEEGDVMWIELEEMGVSGDARVVSIRGPPELDDGEGRVVTGTFRRVSNNVFSLYLVGDPEPLQGTGRHPVYSLDRDAWVRIAELVPGERLQTLEGEAVVLRRDRLEGDHEVFNFEVEAEHELVIGGLGVRARNAYHRPHHIDARKTEAHELRFIHDMMDERPGGHHIGNPRHNFPGIDGHLNGVPISLKQTVGGPGTHSPRERLGTFGHDPLACLVTKDGREYTAGMSDTTSASRTQRAKERRARLLLRRTTLDDDAPWLPVVGTEGIALCAQLSRECWTWAQKAVPSYARAQIPVRFVPHGSDDWAR